MKKLVSVVAFLFLILPTIETKAQVGIGTTNPSGALDITSTDNGLLIPRVALINTTTVLPVLTGTESELVYNTSNNGSVTPGFYYLSAPGGPWVRLGAGATNPWLITGNTNIVNGTHFIGTGIGNDADVAFRRNNSPAGIIGATSTSFGVGALNAGAATNSTAFGTNALNANTTGTDNVAVGNGALAANTTGIQNTAVGKGALATNTSIGANNTALGFQALAANTTGAQNTAVGSGT